MTQQQIFELVRRKTVEVLCDVPEHEIAMTSNLQDLGANSVDRADIITQSMEELQLRAPATAFAGARDVGALVRLLEEKLRGTAGGPEPILSGARPEVDRGYGGSPRTD
jgi:polyketide biosynthesis acyl carrier protein